MQIKTRKRISLALVVCLCLTLVIGSFAFFTDRETADATANAGNIDLVFTDTSKAEEGLVYEVVDGQLKEVTNKESALYDNQQVDKVWDSTTGMLVQDGVLNPGDTIDMDYNLKNTGSKSIDVRQQIIVTVTDKDNQPLTLTDPGYEYIMETAAEIGLELVADASKPAEGKLVYRLADVTLQGTVEKDGAANNQEFDIALAFAREAKNAFMGSHVTVELEIQAKQHRNTSDADWMTWASFTTGTQGDTFEKIPNA